MAWCDDHEDDFLLHYLASTTFPSEPTIPLEVHCRIQGDVDDAGLGLPEFVELELELSVTFQNLDFTRATFTAVNLGGADDLDPRSGFGESDHYGRLRCV